MKNIVYISTAVKLMSEDQLTDILTVSRRNNSANDVSGILLYGEGTFIQLLEGGEEQVDEVFTRIALDKRHKNITVLIDDEVKEKNFADWSMGFTTTSTNANVLQQVAGFLNLGIELKAKDKNSQAANILKAFIDTNKLAVTY